MTLVSILSVGSLVIYFFDASTSLVFTLEKIVFKFKNFFFSRPIETCQKWKESVSQQIDLGFNLFFMLYFFIRVKFKKKKFFY